MYEYKFVKDFVVGQNIIQTRNPIDDYHKIIEENAKDGWRLVQIFAPVLGTPNYATEYFELIFEREVKQNDDE